MCLASDVRDITGRLLLKSGEVIADRHLYIFRSWGVTEADIETASDEPEQPEQPAGDPALLREVEAELKQRFAHTNFEMPFVQELFRLAVARRVSILEGTELQ